jgi:hypothetical protein
MGLEGEYDVTGLAKRVAAAFDRDTNLSKIETLDIAQDGSTILLKGSVPEASVLDHLVEIAEKVDGSKAIDTSQVTIQSH